jgi:hypothetical protein
VITAERRAVTEALEETSRRAITGTVKDAGSGTVTQALAPIAGATEMRVTQVQYEAALQHVFASHYLNPITRTVEGIGQRAARLAVDNPRFIQAIQQRNWTLAGTLFHSAAAIEARAVLAAALPPGWTLEAEQTIQHGLGGSRADILLQGPKNEVVEFDWKTSGRSALSTPSRREMVRHAGHIAANIGGTLTVQESRTWVDFVREVRPGLFK